MSRKRGMYEEMAESEIMTQIATFLAGILFASILLVFQIKNNFEYEFVFMGWHTGTSMLDVVTGSLSLTCLFFIFLSLSTLLKGKSFFSLGFQVVVFFLAFGSLFISLYLILSQLSQIVANISLIISVALFILWFIFSITE